MKLSRDDMVYLDRYLSVYADLPVGAWQTACEASIRKLLHFEGRDAHDVWLAWAAANAYKELIS